MSCAAKVNCSVVNGTDYIAVMGKCQSRLGFKSQFEHLLRVIWQFKILFGGQWLGFDSIQYFFAIQFGPWDLTAESLLVVSHQSFSVFSCLACWVNWFSYCDWNWCESDSHTHLRHAIEYHWQWCQQIASCLLCCTDCSSCLCSCGRTGIWDLIGILSTEIGIWGLDLGIGIWDLKIWDFYVRLEFDICPSLLRSNQSTRSCCWSTVIK